MPFKALKRGEQDDPSAWHVDLAGELTSIHYEGPGGRSILEVMRNYEAALKSNGLEFRFLFLPQPEGLLAHPRDLDLLECGARQDRHADHMEHHGLPACRA